MVLSVTACCVRPSYGVLCVVNGDDSAVFHYLSLVTLTFELGRDFCTMFLTAKFDHPTCSCSEVIVRTKKQTDPAENIRFTTLRRWVVTNGVDDADIIGCMFRVRLYCICID